LQSVGLAISEREIQRLLTEKQDDFLDETRDVLRAGLRTRPSKSRLNFLDLPCRARLHGTTRHSVMRTALYRHADRQSGGAAGELRRSGRLVGTACRLGFTGRPRHDGADPTEAIWAASRTTSACRGVER
jgi:hypothetical protein